MDTTRCIFFRSVFFIFLFVFFPVLFILGVILPVHADTTSTLEEAHNLYNQALEYKKGFHEGENNITYQKIIENYNLQDTNKKTPATKLREAFQAFKDILSNEPSNTDAATGLLDCMYEIARAEMLLGNEDLAKVMRLENITGDNPIDDEIGKLESSINHYSEAISYFLTMLQSSSGLTAFLELEPSRNYSKSDTKGYKDTALLAYVASRKAFVYNQLGSLFFARDYNNKDKPEDPEELPASLKDTREVFKKGAQGAYFEGLLASSLFSEERIKNSENIKNVSSQIQDYGEIYGYILKRKNPFGYDDGYVRFMYNDAYIDDKGLHNYHAHKGDATYGSDKKITDATTEMSKLTASQQKLKESENNYNQFQKTFTQQELEYREQLIEILGPGSSTDKVDNDLDGLTDDSDESTNPDFVTYLNNAKGEIGRMFSNVKVSQLNIDRVQQQMKNLQERVNIQVALLSELARINADELGAIDGVVEEKVKIIAETGKELSTLAIEMSELAVKIESANHSVEQTRNGTSFLNNASTPWGYFMSFYASFINLEAADDAYFEKKKIIRNQGSIEANKQEIYAMEKSKLTLLDHKISEIQNQASAERTNAQIEADIKQILLERPLLEIDMMKELEIMYQQSGQLYSLIDKSNRLKSDWDVIKAESAQIAEYYTDPSHRILRDESIIKAFLAFNRALKALYLTGKALEYDINESIDDVQKIFRIRNIKQLTDLNDEFEDIYSTAILDKEYMKSVACRIFSLRQDLLGLDPAGYNEKDDEAWQGFLEEHTIPTGEPQAGSLKVEFKTALARGGDGVRMNFFNKLSTDPSGNDNFPQSYWGLKVRWVAVNIDGLTGSGLNDVSVFFLQCGPAYMRTRYAKAKWYEIYEDDIKEWNIRIDDGKCVGTRVFNSPIDKPLDPSSACNFNNYADAYKDQLLVGRSVSNSSWSFVLLWNWTQHEDLLKMTDIQFIIQADGYILHTETATVQ